MPVDRFAPAINTVSELVEAGTTYQDKKFQKVLEGWTSPLRLENSFAGFFFLGLQPMIDVLTNSQFFQFSKNFRKLPILKIDLSVHQLDLEYFSKAY